MASSCHHKQAMTAEDENAVFWAALIVAGVLEVR